MQQFDFTAWSLYTGPSFLEPAINDPNCSWVVGQWNGVNSNTSAAEIRKDIDMRIDLIVQTFKKVLPYYKTFNRHFVIPEFFFHCQEGPYPYLKVDGNSYPFDYIVLTLRDKLKASIPNDNNYYEIIIGSVLTSNVEDYTTFLKSNEVIERQNQLNAILSPKSLRNGSKIAPTRWSRHFMAEKSVEGKALMNANSAVDDLNNFMLVSRGNPLCTVRNRGAFFRLNKTMMPDIEMVIYEKQYESTVDLTMGVFDASGKITNNGMITEWIGNYPSYSILNGDKQTTPISTNARFNPSFVGFYDYGIEICLDHRLQRLRRTVDMSKANGAAADNFPLFKQFVPSGGMQILDYSVAANRNSIIFNADGCDKVYYVYTDPNSAILNGKAGLFKGITCGVYNRSVQSEWVARDGQTYYSHSQLAFAVNDSVVDGFNNAKGLNNLKALTYYGTPDNPYNELTDSYSPVVVQMRQDSLLFAGSTGDLHYYDPS